MTNENVGNFENVLSRTEADERLEVMLARVADLKKSIAIDRAKGESMAEIALQRQLLAGLKAGMIGLSPADASYLHSVTEKQFKGKNGSYAKQHLDDIFKLPALARSVGAAAKIAPPKAPTVQGAPFVSVAAKPAMSTSPPVISQVAVEAGKLGVEK
jgi:hypothetical protein